MLLPRGLLIRHLLKWFFYFIKFITIEYMELGWICLHRKILDNFLFKENRKLSKAEAWIYILLNVNHSDNNVLIGNQNFVCCRGESLKSYDSWAKLFNWDKSKVVRFFDLLKKNSMIELKSEVKTIRIKVLNYDSYNDLRNSNETQTKRKRNAKETQMKPNNNDNNDNNDNNKITFEFFENLNLNGTKDKYLELTKSFISFRKSIKKPFKTQTEIETWVKKILKLSNCNINIATEIIENSISNGWQGIFPLKNNYPQQIDLFKINSEEINKIKNNPNILKFK